MNKDNNKEGGEKQPDESLEENLVQEIINDSRLSHDNMIIVDDFAQYLLSK